ncbi:CAP domain-containing protein [Candidatus Parcubacteria bacterium]|nr:CAP domain-containing protein [Candidatus Parcubacteria bacterium]
MKTKTNENGFLYWRVSLLCVIIGIFLLPQLAFLFSITDENIINITNKERIKENLNPLTANQLLGKAAYDKGQAIMASQRFGHNILDEKFSHWIKEAGYQYSYIGENLAVDFYTNEGIMKAWLKSPTHRKNILNEKFSEIGVAVVSGNLDGKETTLVVQIFGRPLAIASANPQTVAKSNAFTNQLSILPEAVPSTFSAIETASGVNLFASLPEYSYYHCLNASTETINKTGNTIMNSIIPGSADFLALKQISQYSAYLFLFLLLILITFLGLTRLNQYQRKSV